MVVFGRIWVFVSAFFYLFAALFTGNGWDSTLRYKNTVAHIECYENSIKTAVPQTEMYNYINEHFKSTLPYGKTVKKAIVIGYDGARADALSLIDDEHTSAIAAVLNDGGHAFVTYAGGKNYPDNITQKTSTAPGWCSMLTGQWATKTGITDNDIVKSNDYLTILTTLVEDKIIDNSAFYVSWDGHFVTESSTYIKEKQYIADKQLDVNFLCADNDEGTKNNVLADLNKADCSDFIFSIIESPDHIGHDKGFSIYNDTYPDGFYTAEEIGMSILETVKARPTYDTEDWLIVITSDHGGSCLGHGGVVIQERMTFVVSNKDLLNK